MLSYEYALPPFNLHRVPVMTGVGTGVALEPTHDAVHGT